MELPSDLPAEPSTSHIAPLLQSLLSENDLPCPLCGYNLRNLKSDRCPECGEGLTLQIGLLEPRLGAYIALLAACCVGLGGSALFSMVGLAAAPASWWRTFSAIVLLVQLILTAAALPIILRKRTRFRRLSPKVQRNIALAVCAVVAVLSATFVVTFKDH
jgi:hypothetical protein